MPANREEQPRKRQKVAPVVKAGPLSGDTAYDQGIEIINSLQAIDKLMVISLGDLNVKYQQAINFFYDAAEIYSAAHQHKDVRSTYKEMAKNCELHIADKIVDLAIKKNNMGEKTEAIHCLEMACGYYEMAISLLEPNIPTLSLYWSCLYTLELRMEIMPESKKMYGDQIKEFIDRHDLSTKVHSGSVQAHSNTELLGSYARLAQSAIRWSEENIQYYTQKSEELNQKRNAIKREMIESEISAKEAIPDFLSDFEDTIQAFTNEISSHLNIKSIGEHAAKIAMIYSRTSEDMRWAGGREGIKVIDRMQQKFNELALLLGHNQNHSLQLNNSTQTPRAGLFNAPAYPYDLRYQQREEAGRVSQNPAKYFAEMLSKHIIFINHAIPFKAEKMISILFFQLGKKIANRQMRDLPANAGFILIEAAKSHGHVEAAQWLRENSRPGLRVKHLP